MDVFQCCKTYQKCSMLIVASPLYAQKSILFLLLSLIHQMFIIAVLYLGVLDFVLNEILRFMRNGSCPQRDCFKVKDRLTNKSTL
jgi:hypothetical protein